MKKGFTFIELLVVMGVIGILVAISVPSYRIINEHVTLGNDADEIVDILRTAQNRSLTGQDGITHGVHFENNSYTIFGDDWSNPSYSHTYELGLRNIFTSGSGTTITFARLTGRSDDFTIVLSSSGGKSKTVSVYASGKISKL